MSVRDLQQKNHVKGNGKKILFEFGVDSGLGWGWGSMLRLKVRLGLCCEGWLGLISDSLGKGSTVLLNVAH